MATARVTFKKLLPQDKVMISNFLLKEMSKITRVPVFFVVGEILYLSASRKPMSLLNLTSGTSESCGDISRAMRTCAVKRRVLFARYGQSSSD